MWRYGCHNCQVYLTHQAWGGEAAELQNKSSLNYLPISSISSLYMFDSLSPLPGEVGRSRHRELPTLCPVVAADQQLSPLRNAGAFLDFIANVQGPTCRDGRFALSFGVLRSKTRAHGRKPFISPDADAMCKADKKLPPLHSAGAFPDFTANVQGRPRITASAFSRGVFYFLRFTDLDTIRKAAFNFHHKFLLPWKSKSWGKIMGFP